MKKLIPLLIILLLALFFYLLPQPIAPQGTMAADINTQPESNSFLLGPIQLFDGETLLPNRFVEVRDGRIKRIHTDKVDTTLPVINAHGQYLMPGLIDAHVHSYGDALRQSLRFGVTTVIDMFGSHQFLAERKAIRSTTQKTDEADIYGAGTLVTTNGGHGTQFGMPIPVINGAEQATDFVASRLAEGSDFIKIVYTSVKATYQHGPSIDYATLKAVIDATHQKQKLAVVHIADLVSAEEAIAAGADGLVHSFFDKAASASVLTQMAQQQRFIIPTLTIYEGMNSASINEELLLTQNTATGVTPAIRTALTQRFGHRIPSAFFQHALDNTAAMHQHGITILAGTDAPNPNTAHGISMPIEMVLLQRAGLPALEVLKAGTSNAANAFGLPDVGYLKPGYKADMILLANDPTTDARNLLNIKAIWKNGWPVNQHVTLKTTANKFTGGLVADFTNGLAAVSGQLQASADSLMHGNSHAEISWHNHSSLLVVGERKAGFSYPWAGVAWQTAADINTGVDMSALSTLQFRLRGTPGQYRLDVFSAGSFMPASYNFTVSENWQQFAVPLATFTSLNQQAVSMAVWNGPQGSFSFELDDIELR